MQSTYATKNRREDGVEGEGLAGVAPDFTAYLDAMIAERKASADPPDDFVTRLINTEVDGQRLTDLEMRTQLAFLLMSGNETTRHLIANMLETVCSDAALFARLRAERDLVPTVVEESLRHDPPIHVLMRDCLAGRHDRRRHDPGRRQGRLRPRVGKPRRANLRRPRRVPARPPEREGPPRLRRRPARLPGRVTAQDSKAASRSRCSWIASTRATSTSGYRREPVPVFWANGPRRLPVTLTGAGPNA